MSRQAIQPEQGGNTRRTFSTFAYSPQEHRRRLPTPTTTPTATLALTGFSGQSLVSQKILKKVLTPSWHFCYNRSARLHCRVQNTIHINHIHPMKKKATSQSAFFNLRILIGAFFCLGAVAVAPTPTLAQCSWSPGPSLPSIGTRFVAVFFHVKVRFSPLVGRFSTGAVDRFPLLSDTVPFETGWIPRPSLFLMVN